MAFFDAFRFQGVRLSFSGVFSMSIAPHVGREWLLALSMGGSCGPEVDPQTTHLVYVQRGDLGVTEKLQRAIQSDRVEVVSPEWLDACHGAWGMVDESLFRPRVSPSFLSACV